MATYNYNFKKLAQNVEGCKYEPGLHKRKISLNGADLVDSDGYSQGSNEPYV